MTPFPHLPWTGRTHLLLWGGTLGASGAVESQVSPGVPCYRDPVVGIAPQGQGGLLSSLRRASCLGAKGKWMAQSVGMPGRPGRPSLWFGCMRLVRRLPPLPLQGRPGPIGWCTLMVLLSGPGGSPPVPDPWWIGRAWRGTLVRGGFTPLGFWAAGVPHRACGLVCRPERAVWPDSPACRLAHATASPCSGTLRCN